MGSISPRGGIQISANKNSNITRTWKIVILIVFNIIIITGLLYGFEYYLRLTDTRRKVLESIQRPESGFHTFGKPVENNRFGFREREFAVPKPAGVCRIMVLGDSQTWGWGLAVENCYTNVAENYLDEAFSDRDFEILNFAWPGLPMVVERDILRDFKDLVNPNLIVVGFFVNDPQPRVQQVKYEEPYEHLRRSILQITEQLASFGLPQVGTKIQVAIDNLVVKVRLVPPPNNDLTWTYGQNTTEWAQFKQALQDIKIMSDELNLPPPVIVFIENFIPPGGYTPLWQQVEEVASEIGFTTYDHENKILEWVAQGKIQNGGRSFHRR